MIEVDPDRTGTMQVRTVTPSRIDLNPDQVQACAGDEGGAWVVPDGSGGSANEVVALESWFTSDPTTRCSRSGTLDKAVRLRVKMAWIESIIGTCSSRTDGAGHQVKSCAKNWVCTPETDSSSNRWDGCNGSGCSVCDEKVAGAYPKYFDHHRDCSRNTACNGSYSRCSASCPPPTVLDTCDGVPDDYPDSSVPRWNGCRGSGCSACSDLIDGTYPKYFANHPECVRNTTCGGEHYRCSTSCPPPIPPQVRASHVGVGSDGSIWLTGETTKTTFPFTIRGFQTSHGGGNHDAFVIRVNPSNGSVVNFSFYGGPGIDRGGKSMEMNGDLAVTSTGTAYVTGTSYSNDFPRVPSASVPLQGDAFVTQLNATGGFSSSILLGGSAADAATAIAVSGASLWMGATSISSSFPGAPAAPGNWDGLLTKMTLP